MYREVIREYRTEGKRAYITLTSGKYVIGVIVGHGPEALVVQIGQEQQLIMKHAIETIRPAAPVRKNAKEA